MELTPRDIALIALVTGVGLWLLMSRSVRSSIGALIRRVLTSSLTLYVLLFVLYLTALVALAARVGIWTPALLKETAVWVAVGGLGLFGKFTRIREPRFIRNRVLATITVSEVVNLLVDTTTFSLLFWLVVIPSSTLLGVLKAYTDGREGQERLDGCLDRVLSVAGLAFLGLVLLNVSQNLHRLEWPDMVLQLYLPIWLTVGALPFVYALGIFAAFEQAFTTLDFFNAKHKSLSLRAKLAVIAGFLFHLDLLHGFAWSRRQEMYKARSFREAREIVRSFKQEPTKKVAEPSEDDPAS